MIYSRPPETKHVIISMFSLYVNNVISLRNIN